MNTANPIFFFAIIHIIQHICILQFTWCSGFDKMSTFSWNCPRSTVSFLDYGCDAIGSLGHFNLALSVNKTCGFLKRINKYLKQEAKISVNTKS